MSKAILILDMPGTCSDCTFLDDNYDYPMCTITNETRGYNFNTRVWKMDKCPLMPLPEDGAILIDGLLNTIAEQVDDKMTYVCGCRNCIETVKSIIKGDLGPLENQCKYCHPHRECPQKGVE